MVENQKSIDDGRFYGFSLNIYSYYYHSVISRTTMKHKLSKSFKKILGAEQQLEKHDFKNENTAESLGKDTNTKLVNTN